MSCTNIFLLQKLLYSNPIEATHEEENRRQKSGGAESVSGKIPAFLHRGSQAAIANEARKGEKVSIRTDILVRRGQCCYIIMA